MKHIVKDNKHIVKGNKLCIEISNYTTDDAHHIFMSKKDENGRINDGYHFVFVKNNKNKYIGLRIYHTEDGYKYNPINDEEDILIKKAVEHHVKLTKNNIMRLIKMKNDELDKFFRYLVFSRQSAQKEAEILERYTKDEEFRASLPSPTEELTQDKINKKKADFYKKDFEFIDQNANTNSYIDDDYLKNLFSLKSQENKIKQTEKAFKKKLNTTQEQHAKKMREQCNKEIKQEKQKLVEEIFDRNNLPGKIADPSINDKCFNEIFNKSKILSINLSRDLSIKNSPPLSCTMQLLEENKKTVCTLTIKLKQPYYEINCNFGQMKYTQYLKKEAIDLMVLKTDNTKETIQEVVKLFYNKLSTFFGVNVDKDKQQKIPYIFNVQNIEFIDGKKFYPKHQQGYGNKNGYQLIYEKHGKMCICDKHNQKAKSAKNASSEDTGAQDNITADQVLYYGGKNDEDKREEKENTFNKYCGYIKDFPKLKNEPSAFDWGVNEKPIYNANAYGTTAAEWRPLHQDWNKRSQKNKNNQNIKSETKIYNKNNLKTVDKIVELSNEYSSNNPFADNEENNNKNTSHWYDFLFCCKTPSHEEDEIDEITFKNNNIITSNNIPNIDENDIEELEQAPIIVGKSMFAPAKPNNIKTQNSRCLPCSLCAKGGNNDSQTEMNNIIDQNIYGEMPPVNAQSIINSTLNNKNNQYNQYMFDFFTSKHSNNNEAGSNTKTLIKDNNKNPK